jgi:hypothetical protein
MKTLVLALVSFFALADPGAEARNWRTLTATRARGTTDSLHVVVRYDAGNVSIVAAAAPLLYDAKARFDASQQRLSRSYDATSRTLRIGLDSSTMQRAARHSSRARDREGYLDLGLASGIPLDLDLDLGTTRAKVDLSSLWVSTMRVSSGTT